MMASKTNHDVFVIAACTVFLLGLSRPALAEVTFDWVTIANPGNAADPEDGDINDEPGIQNLGSVAYVYRVAKHEVTNEQYAEFLNAVAATDANGLFDEAMELNPRGGIMQDGSSGSFTYSVKPCMGNKPVIYVNFFDVMRFVNWLHNGQPTGPQDASTTEDGVYAVSDGVSETRAADAQFFLLTEDEWYKAAYHQPAAEGGDTDDYWSYATASNSVPTVATADNCGNITNPGPNVANYDRGADWNGQDGNVTTVGSAGPLSESFYGTKDQSGNVWDWIETLAYDGRRVTRGGSYSSVVTSLSSSIRNSQVPSLENANSTGFRVARPATGDAVPTVSEWGLIVMSLLVLTAGTLLYARRRPTAA